MMDIGLEDRNENQSDTTTIKLHKGEPDETMIPFNLLEKATQKVFADEKGRHQRTYWTYGEDEGNTELRHQVINFLRHTCAIATLSYENIFITNGTSAILDQICTMFLRAGDTILVECPTYSYGLQIFRDHHLHIISYSVDDDGLVIDSTFINDVLERTKPKMIYIVPTFQNPAGVTMSHHRREQLVQLSLKYHFLIVADEVYHHLDYEKQDHNSNGIDHDRLVEHPKSFAAYHAAGTVVALHSFSKILTPALRLGFACASHEHVNAMGRYGLIHSGGGANPFVSGIVARTLEDGSLKKFIDEKLCVEYGKRMRVLYNELMQIFGEKHITCRRPSGGYFLWVKFNDAGVDCDQLLIIARKYGVTFSPGRLFAHDEEAKAKLAHCLRLCFTIVDCEQLRVGCARLKQAFEEYKNITL
ncbi:unnamed protein product [Rotaria socialis]|uniref:Aminotransferase class I/classII large domain-containing protein n=1 Tax=Rotaria socialis TaxID=392032 RepID=A0A819W2P5_9BILA|nr:unnamed protein product [Rotaria socialis]CAF3614724.1 unnamed protein product [Rotaria socialis]CAF4117523.1 unnamed protein product [Rotaria socialis]CAF4128991.1 unnamed protein product [Rotaria socialis]